MPEAAPSASTPAMRTRRSQFGAATSFYEWRLSLQMGQRRALSTDVQGVHVDRSSHGHTTFTLSDGRRSEPLDHGVRRFTYPSGREETIYRNGHEEFRNPNGSEVVYRHPLPR
jgi:hypothetical protein